MTRSLVSIVALAGAASAALASDPGFAASTDRVAYTGQVTRYGTLADAQGAINPVSGPHGIPNRSTSAPYDTPNRDLALFFVDNYGSYSSDYSVMLTAWYYTTQGNTNALPKDDPSGDRYYSGWGNPNNTNTGFMQLYDIGSNTVTSSSAAFGNFNGTHYTEFNLQSSFTNAGAAEYARLWAAPTLGGAASITGGTFISADLDITFGGLEGSQTSPGVIESFNHPTSVSGSFSAIFQNTGSDGSLHGFYVAEFTFNMDSWAFGQDNADLNGDFSDSYFATVPAPASAALLGLGGLIAARRRRA